MTFSGPLPLEAVEAIHAARTVYLSTHQHSDGDAIGSELAWRNVLIQLGKQVVIANHDPIPATLRFLPSSDQVTVYGGEEVVPDLLIAVECPDPERLGSSRKLLEKAKATLNIDHHPTNTRFGTWNVIDAKAAAVGEIMFECFEQLRGLHEGATLLNLDVAKYLYAAIMTDTGRFGYSSTTAKTHQITAALLEQGVDPYPFVRNLYEESTLGRFQLLARALSTLRVMPGQPVAWMKVSHEMYEETETSSEDTEGFVNYPRGVQGVEVGFLLREDEPGLVRVSLRSVNRVKVSEIAQQFGGGGHVRAAGCTIRGSLQDAEKKILELVTSALLTVQ